MSLLQKTFRIGLGGRGTKEVERFISTHIGRDLSLIEGLDATSINPTTTELTLTYRDYPNVSPVLASNPPNGFVASTGHPVQTLFLQYSTPIDESSLQVGDVVVDGNDVEVHDLFVESGMGQFVLSVNAVQYYNDPLPYQGIHTVLLDKGIKNTRGLEQNNSTLIGYTHSSRAGPSVGDSFVHSANDLRGTTKLRYAIFDSSVNTNKKIGEMIKTANELLAFTSVQKENSTTEVFTLVTDQLEPRIVGTFPRQGANNPDTDEFQTLTLTFQDSIDVNQVSNQSGMFAVNHSFGYSEPIYTGNINAIDDKTIQISVANQIVQSSITNNYVNVMVYVGLRSQGGLATTKGYTFGYSTNDFALAGGRGAVGPPGPTGATGVAGEPGQDGEPGGPPGPTGATGVSGIPGFSGVPGASGVPGISGRPGVTGVPGVEGIEGPQGLDGDDGADGAAGADGARGPVGDTGASGSRWFNSGGAPFDGDFTSAADGDYFVFSLPPIEGPGALYRFENQTWILTGNIRGEPGEIGEIGEIGVPGDEGAQGPAGSSGAIGPQGEIGVTPEVTPDLVFTGVHNRVEIDLLFKIGISTPYFTGDTYTELTRDGGGKGDITTVDIWDTSFKDSKLFTKIIDRDVSGNVTGTFTTDNRSNATLRVNLGLSSGNIYSIEKLYTP